MLKNLLIYKNFDYFIKKHLFGFVIILYAKTSDPHDIKKNTAKTDFSPDQNSAEF